MSDEPLNTFDRDESDSYCPVEAKPENKQPLPVYHGELTDAVAALGSVKSADVTQGGKDGLDGLVEAGKVTFSITSYFADGNLPLNINDHKLLTYAVAKFTANNNHLGKDKPADGKTANRDVNIPVKDFARALGYAVDPADNSPKAKARAKGELDHARSEVIANIRTLSRLQAVRTGRTDEGSKNVLYANYISFAGVVAGEIVLSFTEPYSAYLLSLPITQYPQAMFAIPGKDPNAYNVGLQMIIHANMDGNIRKGTASRLTVGTLLKSTNLPTIDQVRKKGKSWSERIKTPLLNVLNHLTKYGVLSTWHFVGENGKALTEKELKGRMANYSTFVELRVEFDLAEQVDHENRLSRRAEDQVKRIEATRTKRKAKSGKK